MSKLSIPKIIIFWLIGIFFTQIVFSQNFESKPIVEKKEDSIKAPAITKLTKLDGNCVLISGYFAFDKNFFLNSCGDKWTLKSAESIGYVNDLIYTEKDSGWMIIGNKLVKINHNKLVVLESEALRNKSFSKIYFTDINNGWVVGEEGVILHTSDGGLDWQLQDSQTKFDLVDVLFTTANKGWAIGIIHQSDGADFILFSTVDAGNTWKTIKQKENEEVIKLFFLDKNHGWGILGNGDLKITTNGGKSWDYQKTNIAFNDIKFVNEKSGWAVGKHIYQTNDGGKTWKINHKMPNDDPFGLDEIVFTDINHGWAINLEVVLQTTNGGLTWKKIKFEKELLRMIEN